MYIEIYINMLYVYTAELVTFFWLSVGFPYVFFQVPYKFRMSKQKFRRISVYFLAHSVGFPYVCIIVDVTVNALRSMRVRLAEPQDVGRTSYAPIL